MEGEEPDGERAPFSVQLLSPHEQLHTATTPKP